MKYFVRIIIATLVALVFLLGLVPFLSGANDIVRPIVAAQFGLEDCRYDFPIPVPGLGGDEKASEPTEDCSAYPQYVKRQMSDGAVNVFMALLLMVPSGFVLRRMYRNWS